MASVPYIPDPLKMLFTCYKVFLCDTSIIFECKDNPKSPIEHNATTKVFIKGMDRNQNQQRK